MLKAEFDRLYGLTRSLLLYYGSGRRRRRIRAFYADFVRPGDLCFDIGANVGDRSYAFSRLGARVVALEPQPDFARWCRWLFKGREVSVLEQAAGAETGVMALRISRRHPTVSTLSTGFLEAVEADPTFDGVAWDRMVSVPVTTLDRLIAEFGEPAFAKIDVEGFEDQVLSGLSRPLACLSFEYLVSTMPTALACIDYLERLGRYCYNGSRGESLSLVFDGWQDADGIRRWLRAQAAAPFGSGDIYARLAVPPAAAEGCSVRAASTDDVS